IGLPSAMVGWTFFDVMCELKKNQEILCVGVENKGDQKLTTNPDGAYRLGSEDDLIVIATSRPVLN
ncbi:MAG: hypothetical protein JRE27_08465, partial [Deltaproteobacteria bacterium]|nr:hypothetical protein [Deltaproteobacteria bacterium]